MAAWFDDAMHINANDGSAVSEFVRGATIWQGEASGLPADDAWFQAGSDSLASSVVNDVLGGRVNSLTDIIGTDVSAAVVDLHLENPDRWAGTIGDWLL
jgi:hypothetical protein